MEEASNKAAAAAGKAYAHLVRAQRHLVGRKLPLAGIQRDAGAALSALHSARRQITVAIELVETARTKESSTGDEQQPVIRTVACPRCGLTMSVSQEAGAHQVEFDVRSWQRVCKRPELGSPVLCFAAPHKDDLDAGN
jgi:hypothetical protein